MYPPPHDNIYTSVRSTRHKGVYPQNDGRLAVAHIDASKGFIDLWVHFVVAIEDNYFEGKGVFLVSTKFKHV